MFHAWGTVEHLFRRWPARGRTQRVITSGVRDIFMRTLNAKHVPKSAKRGSVAHLIASHAQPPKPLERTTRYPLDAQKGTNVPYFRQEIQKKFRWPPPGVKVATPVLSRKRTLPPPKLGHLSPESEITRPTNRTQRMDAFHKIPRPPTSTSHAAAQGYPQTWLTDAGRGYRDGYC